MKLTKTLLVGVAGLVIAVLVLVIINMNRMSNDSRTINDYIDRSEERYAEEQKKEDDFIEDGAVVGDIYTIKSTKEISDAYINGKDPSKLSEEDKDTYEMAVEILEKETKGCNTLYEKEKAIFEWIANNVKHSEDASTRAVLAGGTYPMDTPNGVLHAHSAVCVGYATTFRLFMNMLGAECHIPHNESHSWDLVKLDDDEWYYVDLYSAVSGQGINYGAFNLNEISATGTLIDVSAGSTSLPKANGKKYLYPVQMAESAADFYEMPKQLKKAIKDKKEILSLRFEKDPDETEILMASSVVSSVQARLEANPPKWMKDMKGMNLTSAWCKDENEKTILAIYITFSGNTDDFDKDSPEAKKVREILDKLFGESAGYDPMAPDNGGMEGEGDYAA